MLSDSELKRREAEFEIRTDNADFPFWDSQIQPCSIDIRLSEEVWFPKLSFRSLSLSPTNSLGQDVSRKFKRKRISIKDGFLILPGRFVLGRTYEAFCVPHDLTAEILGRSSIGRLGLSVSAPSSFINPGWRGHMPLMLINHSPFPIKVYPYVGICQLVYRSVTGKVNAPYGSAASTGKYQDDDGGPSRFWLDTTVKAVTGLRTGGIEKTVSEKIEKFAFLLDEPTRMRLAKLVEDQATIESPRVIIDKLCKNIQTTTAITNSMPWVTGLVFSACVAGPRIFEFGLVSSLLVGGAGLVASIVSVTVWFFRTRLAPMPSSEVRAIRNGCDWL